MPIRIQAFLIKHLLRPLAGITEKVSDGKKNMAVVFSIFAIAVLQMVLHYGENPVRYIVLYIPSCFFLGVIILVGLRTDMAPAKFDRFAAVCWGMVTLWIGITGFAIRVDELSEFALWLVAFPIFHLVWGNQYQRLSTLLTKGVSLSFVPFFVVCMVGYPISGSGYSGFCTNPNTSAEYLTIVIVCMLMELFALPKGLWKAAIYIIGISLAGSLMYYTNSRTGLLATALCVLVAIIAAVVQRRNWRVFLRIGCAVMLTVLLIPVTVRLFSACYTLVENRTAVVSSELEISSMDESLEKQNDPDKVLQEINQISRLKMLEKHADLNDYTTGRVDLWQVYWKKVGFFGNPADEIVYDKYGEVEERSSHLTQLQFAYQYGILAGVFLLLLHIYTGFKAVGFTIRRRREIYSVFPLLVIVAYGVYTLMEANVTTFVKVLVPVYYMMLAPLMLQGSCSVDKATADGGTA